MLVKSSGLEVAFSHKPDNNTAIQLPECIIENSADVFPCNPIARAAGHVHVDARAVMAVKQDAGNDAIVPDHPEALRAFPVLTAAVPLEVIPEDVIPFRPANDAIGHSPSQK